MRYIDGNNNAYVIEEAHIRYEPITPAQSSSGTYSGGSPKTAAITAEQHDAIRALVDRIVADAGSHLTTRPKGCGTIVLDDQRVWFASALKGELEALLKAALSDA